MKKLLILAVALLLGVVSVFAQGAWEVKVSWSNGNCDFSSPPLPGEGFLVGLTIYDAANDIIVVDNASNTEATTATSSTFNVQTAVQTHCNDNTLQNTPSFIIYTAVWMGNIQTSTLYCNTKQTDQPFNCSNFSSGILISGLEVD